MMRPVAFVQVAYSANICFTENLVQDVHSIFSQIGLVSNVAFARDLFNHQDLGFFINVVRAEVNPTGVVMMRLDPIEYPIYKNHISELA